jgi:hypothetical protein
MYLSMGRFLSIIKPPAADSVRGSSIVVNIASTQNSKVHSTNKSSHEIKVYHIYNFLMTF